MKLNLGCGSRILDGWLNVDKFGTPDLKWDLESFPWPWADNSVDEILLSHVLEHLGQDPQTFIGIMRELYRVCRDGATVHIRVPHPRHDNFLIDPTHVRPILAATMEMFSRSANLEWQRTGAPTTPLALYHDVDFELVSNISHLDEPYRSLYQDGKIGAEELQKLDRTLNNVIVEVELVLKAKKQAA